MVATVNLTYSQTRPQTKLKGSFVGSLSDLAAVIMRVLALVSGGKDSTMAMVTAVAQGHHIVAMANLRPRERKGQRDINDIQ